MRRRVSQLTPVWLPALALSLLTAAIPTRAQDSIVLPPGQVGTPYSASIQSAGGAPPLTWRVSGGQLPPGLAVSGAGKIEGTPTAASKQAVTFDLTVSDASTPPQSVVQHFSMVVTAAPLHIVGIATTAPTATSSMPLKIIGASNANPHTVGASVSPADTLKAAPASDNETTRAGAHSDPPAEAAGSTPRPKPDPPQGGGAPAPAPAQFSISVDTPKNCAGGNVALTASGPSADMTSWSVTPANSGVFGPQGTSANAILTTSPGLADGTVLTVTGTAGGVSKTSSITIHKPCLGGEIVRAVVGFEQVGASSTPSSQSFMFNFFITRPVPFWGYHGGDPTWGPRLRWWGDIKVASFPYTQKSSVATIAQQFASTFGSQNLNQLAESISFVTGPEVRLWATGSHGSLTDKDSAALFGLTWFAGAGATGPNNPTDNATVFDSPVAGTSQDKLLRNTYANAAFTNCPAPSNPPTPCTNYVAFVPMSGDRFLQQWGSGFRLYTLFTNKSDGSLSFAAPATIEFSIGQNATVTESHLHNFVGHAAAMYPFSIGPRGATGSVVIYLFGEVNTALAKNHIQNTLTLIPALDANNNPIPLSSPSVYQIPVDANRRDTYRIGVGVDLVTIWKSLTASKSNGGT